MALTKTDSYEKLLEIVERAAWREFDRAPIIDVMGDLSDPGFDTHVHSTFQNTVIFEDEFSDKMYEASYVLMGDSVVFGQMQEVAEMYVEKRMAEAGLEYKKSTKNENSDPEISGPIVMKNAAQRIAYAPVLVPGEKDSDGEIISAEKIEQVAHGWMESYRNVDLMHTLNNTGFPVESYILPMEMDVEAYGQKMTLPVGTWILASKLSEDAWAGVESGVLTGYSVMGIKKAQLDMATKSEEGAIDESAFKRTLLADLGPDWVAAFVSVVDHPAVPKAKFFALKSAEFSSAEEITAAIIVSDSSEKEPTFFAKVGKALGITKETSDSVEVSEDVAADVAEKAGRRYSDKTYDSLKKAFESLSALIAEAEAERQPVDKSAAELSEGPVTDMDDVQLQAIIAEAVKSAVEPLIARLDEMDSASKAEVPAVEVAEVIEEPVAEKATDVVEELATEDEVAPVEEVVEKAEETPVVEEVIEDVVEAAVKEEDEVTPVEEPVVEKAEEVVVPSEEEIAAEAAVKAAAEAKAAEEAAFKSELADRLEKIEQRLGRVATGSNALKNDGGGVPVEETPAFNRDAFGRRVK
jgi:hypothetical protein